MVSKLDLLIIGIYLVGIVIIGLRSGISHFMRGKSESNEYFLAGKSLRWPVIGLALFATNISCIHIVSLAQSGFDTGLLNGNFEWMAAFTLILLALFFVPFYINSGVSTLPDFLEKRYNRQCRDWLTVISIVSAVIIHIAFSLLAGGIVLETLFGVNMYISISVLLLLIGIYTVVGGLKAVVVTESIQTIVLVVGAIIITISAWLKLGGWSSLINVLESSNKMDMISMLRPHNDESGMPWYSVLLGYPILGVWYWCADQTIVQRVLGAKDESHARVGALFCGFIKILPVFIFVLPGLMAYALMENGLLDVSSILVNDVQGEPVVQSKGIYTLMVTQLLPSGLVGVVIAALISALMSTVAGALNSISTLVSYDLIRKFRPGTSDHQLVFYGRISAVVAIIISLLLLPALNTYESLFVGLNDIIAHLAPPITCVFIVGIFWGKASARSAQYTLLIGSIIGILVYSANKLFPDTLLGEIPFMMMAFYLFLFCLLLQIVLSYTFPVKHTVESKSLYWKSPFEPLAGKAWSGLGNYKLLSSILVITMIVLYIIFR
ncbi:sodium:solute symporter [Membranihabitans maritimus]|uniref:sodium:solute symporter n=1 Tax=Membranihabitans maritimus TaxID=2904244 RepID=UPI001F2B2916|nr:sodium:solute symporter [Membranihabitans maritimus]